MTVTLATIAARAGVSKATVSRALAGNYPVAAETRKRIEKVARELDYVVNAHARALLQSTSGIIGVILNDMSDPYFAEIVRGIQSVAADMQRLVVTCNSGGDPDREFGYIEVLRRQRADAVILVGSAPTDADYNRQLAAQVRGLRAQKSCLVLCGRPLPNQKAPAQLVQFDHQGAAAVAAGHVLQLGHRRVAYVGGPEGRSTSIDRLAGFTSAMSVAGVNVDRALLEAGDLGRDSGYEAARRLLAKGRRFTAIVAGNDLMAIGIIAALREAGRQVPDDVSVVGIDDIPFSRDLTPGLTTVRLPLEQAGRQAVSIAFAPDVPTKPAILGHELVVRASTARPRRTASAAAAKRA